MTARIFISYRSADGMDKATALARDLGRTFGDAAVFLDKDDLRGGSAWREEIGQQFADRPVLLLLLTPQLIEAPGADGQLRIADPQDPVRREVETALEAGAHIIPVLCDGLAAAPDAARLPAPFHRIGELTWRKLRAYDWRHDVERLVLDLQALGVPAAAPPPDAPAPASAPMRPPARRRPWALRGLATAGLLVMGATGWWWLQPPATLAGPWAARLARGEAVTLTLAQAGSSLTLATEPIPIADRGDWARYRESFRESTGTDLRAVMYRGAGHVIEAPGQAAAIDVALQVWASPENGTLVDSGNLSARLSADGRQLSGTLWLNSEQAEQPVTLTR